MIVANNKTPPATPPAMAPTGTSFFFADGGDESLYGHKLRVGFEYGMLKRSDTVVFALLFCEAIESVIFWFLV